MCYAPRVGKEKKSKAKPDVIAAVFAFVANLKHCWVISTTPSLSAVLVTVLRHRYYKRRKELMSVLVLELRKCVLQNGRQKDRH